MAYLGSNTPPDGSPHDRSGSPTGRPQWETRIPEPRANWALHRILAQSPSSFRGCEQQPSKDWFCAGICNDPRFCWVFVEGTVRTVRGLSGAWCHIPQMFAGLSGSFAHFGDRSGLTAVFGWNRWAEGREAPGGQLPAVGGCAPLQAGSLALRQTPISRQEIPQPIIESETYASPRTALRLLRGKSSLLGAANPRIMQVRSSPLGNRAACLPPPERPKPSTLRQSGTSSNSCAEPEIV